ncbi:DUF6011 domain-containing protein [Nonomuraea roseola]|uniref:DUF6011 domain-containing protein n=1 Tax=Nonomuraea roseola TaxID=46179 RepID=A0ABV5Q0M6_9ACTN
MPVKNAVTEPQKVFIRKLAAERGLDAEVIEASFDDLTKALASDLITWLKAMDVPAAAKPIRATVEPGFYKLDGKFYEVRESKGGRLYAVEIYQTESGKVTSDYAPGIAGRLKPENLLTLDEAKAFGRETGSCCVCRRELTKQDSIDAGIGPVCADKF